MSKLRRANDMTLSVFNHLKSTHSPKDTTFIQHSSCVPHASFVYAVRFASAMRDGTNAASASFTAHRGQSEPLKPAVSVSFK